MRGFHCPCAVCIRRRSLAGGGLKAFNLIYIAQNVGMAAGASFGGFIAEHSFTAVFVVNGITYAAFTLLIFRGLRGAGHERSLLRAGDERPAEPNSLPDVQSKAKLAALLVLCAGFMNCWVVYSQWWANISKYMTDLGYPISSYSLLWTINGILIVAAQPFIAWMKMHYTVTQRSQLLAGSLLFILSAAVLLATERYWGFVAGMVIVTMGEVFIWPAVPATASELAPKGKVGLYQGIANGFASAGRMLGPLIGGLLYDRFRPPVMLITMLMCFMMVAAAFYFYDRIGRSSGAQGITERAGREMER
ncbi:MFS transporter [Paenibacillus sp. P25]|nr:MFS transporter [Paenibacillus sp. P25]